MRTHEERMAEIHRRSEEWIKLRKKRRKGILFTCIPLVLIVGIFGAWSLTGAGSIESMVEPQETAEECIAVEVERETYPAIMSTAALEGTPYSEYEGLSVQILSLEQGENGTIIRVRWKNDTEKKVVYGSSYFIDAYRGDRWELCAVDENAIFTAIAYFLEPGQEREETYTLAGVYELPETGICRFRTECFVYETEDNSIHCELWDVFEIK